MSVSDWASKTIPWVGITDSGVSNLGYWSSNDGLSDNSWGRTVDDGVESVDGISGVSDGSDGTIGLNEGVLSLDDISVTGFVLLLLVSGDTVSNGVSVVVLWMRVIWLWGDGDLGDWGGISERSDGLSYWGGISESNWSSGISSISQTSISGSSISDSGSNDSGSGTANDGEESGDLDHDDRKMIYLSES